MKKPVLQCDLYDYVEIACLFRIKVELTLANEAVHLGTVVTTGANPDLGEYLFFCIDGELDNITIPLTSIKSMTALSPNPHFQHIDFKFE